MYTIWKLTTSSIKMFVRNKQAVFFTFFTPLIIIVIFGAIGFDRAPKIHVGLAIEGTLNRPTQAFVEELKQIPIYSLSFGSIADQKNNLEKGNRSIVLILSPNPFFEDGNTVRDLKVLSNAGDANVSTALSILNQILDKTTIAMHQTPVLVNVTVEEINSHNLKYIDFLLPGLIALSVMQLAVFSVAFVFVDYKEKGILKRVLATPVRPYQFVIANIITRLLVAVFQAAVFIAIGVIFLKVQVIGSYLLLLPIIILGAIMFLGLGFTVSGMSKTTESVPALANLVVFPMLFLGGTFFPPDSLPTWLQHISKVLPLTYFSGALRDVMTKGSGLGDIYSDMFWMLGWSIVLIFLAVITFSFEEKRGV